MLVREELGLDPDQLGSPWGAAAGSFVAFAIGASIPVIPYLFGGGQAALFVSLGLSLVALFAVGAAVSLLTGRGLVFSGIRQLAIGLARGARDLRDRLDHRRDDRGLSARDARTMSPAGSATRASTRRPGRTVRAIGTPPTSTATTRSSPSSAGRSGSGCRRRSATVDLEAGDRLELPAGTTHDALVGAVGRGMSRGAPAGWLAGGDPPTSGRDPGDRGRGHSPR